METFIHRHIHARADERIIAFQWCDTRSHAHMQACMHCVCTNPQIRLNASSPGDNLNLICALIWQLSDFSPSILHGLAAYSASLRARIASRCVFDRLIVVPGIGSVGALSWLDDDDDGCGGVDMVAGGAAVWYDVMMWCCRVWVRCEGVTKDTITNESNGMNEINPSHNVQ